MDKAHSLQEPFLNTIRKEHVPVSVYLVNGVQLHGCIVSFDQFTILLKNSVSQLVYKHAISTIVPSYAVKLPHETQENAGDIYDHENAEDAND